jgi:YHS domain-containing protein
MKLVPFTLLILTLGFFTTSEAQTNKRVQNTNLTNSVAIDGYDPVAYFTQGKAIKGESKYAVNANGVVYYCSSAGNKVLFEKDFAKYEPQYGGWCAYAMGATGEKVEVDPETFKIVNGKLYLFYNAYFNNTLNSWNKDEYNLKLKADENWKKYNQ